MATAPKPRPPPPRSVFRRLSRGAVDNQHQECDRRRCRSCSIPQAHVHGVESVTADPVSIQGLTKTYRSGVRLTPVHAVRNLTLRVPAGSVVAFVGPNGAGKTTTIHTLLGFLKPDAGTVRMFGEAPGPAVLQRVGYQSEIFH